MSEEAAPSQVGCPDEGALLEYLDGAGEESARVAMRAHLDACDACRELVAALVRGEPAAEPLREPLLPRGASLGRYVVVDPVGRGAMGVVYRAFDPELDRRVAVKVLRPDTGPGKDVAQGRAHLLAEAQAMARLTHPNVITVYDVGPFEGGVFLAMEFVRGRTLRAEVEARADGWRRTLGLYLQAGEALRAAHAAGIVHRDFKPDNVLVGEDGRVRVTDFGLASRDRAPVATGAIAGTPAYMSPEQQRGEDVDATSDQYAFCVALHEALFGVRPNQPVPAASKRVPAELTRVIARGLKGDRTARWPSMSALLHALGRASRRWTPGSLVWVGVLALLAAGLWARHLFVQHRVQGALDDAAARVPGLLAHQAELAALRMDAAVRSPPILAAFESASDLDAALGLAPRANSARQLTDAHELMRSADLPGLKSAPVLLLVNGWGAIIFDGADAARVGDAAPGLPLLLQALNGTGTSELWPADALRSASPPLLRAPGEDLYLLTARPIIRGQTSLGAVLAGEPIRAAMQAEWERQLGVTLRLHPSRAAGATATLPVTDAHAEAVREVPLEALGAGASVSLIADDTELPGVPVGMTAAARWLLLFAFVASALGIAYRGGLLGRHR